nr:uncharacterized protein LOC101239810 [Hydra vulgaris]
MSKSTLEIFEVITLISIDVFALTGNCMIILAFIIGPKSLKTLTNYFVVNLAVADLMVAILPLPFWIVYTVDYNIINSNAIPFFTAADILCGITSILNLTAISLERMFAVKFPTRHYNLSSAPVFVVIAFTWFIGIAFSGARFFIPLNSLRWYTAFIFVFAFALPLFIIVVSYCVIFYCAILMMRENSNQDGKTKQELRVAKTISVIIGLFLFCWSPFFILNMVYAFCKDIHCNKLPLWLTNVTKLLHYSNSMMNFFVYGYRSPDFRHSFRAFTKCNLSLIEGRVRSLSESINRGHSSSFKRERNNENSEEIFLVTLASDEIKADSHQEYILLVLKNKQRESKLKAQDLPDGKPDIVVKSITSILDDYNLWKSIKIILAYIINNTKMSKSLLEIFEIIVLIIIDVCALTGNSMIILAFIIGPKSIKTFTNYFVVNLAVADLMVAVLSLPFWIAYRFDNNIAKSMFFEYFISIDTLCGITSILNLTAISLERMFAVKCPTRHFNLTSLPVLIVIALTWFIGIALTAPRFLTINNTKVFKIYTATLFFCAFIIPLVIIVVSYCVILYCAISMMRESCNQTRKIKRELRVAKTISVIVSLFLICWSPFFIVNMTFIFCTKDCYNSFPVWLVHVTKIMHYSNSIMNFFVYGHRSPDFRRSFRAFINCDVGLLQERVRSFSESVSRVRTTSFRHQRSHEENTENNKENIRKLSESTRRSSKSENTRRVSKDNKLLIAK